MGIWDGYSAPSATNATAASRIVPTQKPSGGVGGFLWDNLIKPVVDSTLRGGEQLRNISNATSSNPTVRAQAGEIKPKQLLADTVTTGTAFAPIGKAKAATEGGLSLLGKLVSGAKTGAGVGAATGGATAFGQDKSGGDVINSALSGAGAGALAGTAAGGVGAFLGRLVNGKTPQPPSRVGTFLEDKGLQTKARAGGYGVGEKISGRPSLGYFDSANIDQTLKDQGIKPGAPTSRLKAVETRLGETGKNIDELIKKNNVELPVGSHGQVVSDFLTAVENQPGASPAVARSAKNLATNFLRQAKDAKSLIDFRRGLDKQVINFAQNPDSKLAADQLAARTFRDVLSEHTNELVPGIKDANTGYHNLVQASEFLKGGAKQISDQSQSAGGGVAGRLLTNETAQAAKSHLGELAQNVGKKINKDRVEPSESSSTATPGKKSALVTSLGPALSRLVGAGAGAAQSSTATLPEQAPLDATQTPDMGASEMTDIGQAAPETSSPYSQENMLADIQRDPKHLNDYLTLYKALNPKPPKANSKTGKPTSQQFGLAQSGLQSLDQLRSFIKDNPGIVGKTAVPGQNLPVVGSLIRNASGTGDYQAAAQNTIDAIARARTGAAMTKSEEAFYQRMLPQPGDRPETVQFKLNQLQEALAPFLGNDNGDSVPSYSDNTELLQALGAQ